MSRLPFVLAGIVMLLGSCTSAGYGCLRLASFEPPANPPFSEALLGVATPVSFPSGGVQTLGVCVQGPAGAKYDIVLTKPDGGKLHEPCDASSACGFEETCTIGPAPSGSSVLITGKAPARCLLHEARTSTPGSDIFIAFLVAVGLAVAAGASGLAAALAGRRD